MRTFREFWNEEPLFGWLSPRGKLYPCESYGHFEVVLDTPELLALLPEATKRSIANMGRVRDRCAERSGRDEAPEWHEYEMFRDDVKTEVIDDMYRLGFLRVASQKEDLHFEGTPEAIRNLHQRATAMAEERWGKATFRPRP